MSNEYSRSNLEEMTVKELRRLCVDTLAIPGMTKKRKDIVIDAILKGVGGGSPKKAQAAPSKTSIKPVSGPIKEMDFSGHSIMNKPYESFGKKTTITIQVTCGASTAAFPVEGKSVSEVAEFLREVLNVDKLSTGLINGKEVRGDYVLKAGDSLEYMKPSGRKGDRKGC